MPDKMIVPMFRSTLSPSALEELRVKFVACAAMGRESWNERQKKNRPELVDKEKTQTPLTITPEESITCTKRPIYRIGRLTTDGGEELIGGSLGGELCLLKEGTQVVKHSDLRITDITPLRQDGLFAACDVSGHVGIYNAGLEQRSHVDIEGPLCNLKQSHINNAYFVCGGKGVCLVDMEKQVPLVQLGYSPSCVNTCDTYHPHLAMSGYENGAVVLWDFRDMRPAGCYKCPRQVSRISFHNEAMVIGGHDGRVRVVDIRAFTPIHDMPVHRGSICTLDWHDDRLVSACQRNVAVHKWGTCAAFPETLNVLHKDQLLPPITSAAMKDNELYVASNDKTFTRYSLS